MNDYKQYRGRGRGAHQPGNSYRNPVPNMYMNNIRRNNPNQNNYTPLFPFQNLRDLSDNANNRWPRPQHNLAFNWRNPSLPANFVPPHHPYMGPHGPILFGSRTPMPMQIPMPVPIDDRPRSPLPGSEEARQKAIAEASARIKEQLNLDENCASDPEKRNVVKEPVEISANVKVAEQKFLVGNKSPNRTRRKVRKSGNYSTLLTDDSSYNVEELRKKILTQFTYMSKGKIQSLVNNPGSTRYDGALQHLIRDMRLHLSSELRTMYNNREGDSNDMIDHFNAIVPDMGVELVSLPDTMVAELSKILQLDEDVINLVDMETVTSSEPQDLFSVNANELIEPEDMFKQAEKLLSSTDYLEDPEIGEKECEQRFESSKNLADDATVWNTQIKFIPNFDSTGNCFVTPTPSAISSPMDTTVLSNNTPNDPFLLRSPIFNLPPPITEHCSTSRDSARSNSQSFINDDVCDNFNDGNTASSANSSIISLDKNNIATTKQNTVSGVSSPRQNFNQVLPTDSQSQTQFECPKLTDPIDVYQSPNIFPSASSNTDNSTRLTQKIKQEFQDINKNSTDPTDKNINTDDTSVSKLFNFKSMWITKPLINNQRNTSEGHSGVTSFFRDVSIDGEEQCNNNETNDGNDELNLPYSPTDSPPSMGISCTTPVTKPTGPYRQSLDERIKLLMANDTAKKQKKQQQNLDDESYRKNKHRHKKQNKKKINVVIQNNQMPHHFRDRVKVKEETESRLKSSKNIDSTIDDVVKNVQLSTNVHYDVSIEIKKEPTSDDERTENFETINFNLQQPKKEFQKQKALIGNNEKNLWKDKNTLHNNNEKSEHKAQESKSNNTNKDVTLGEVKNKTNKLLISTVEESDANLTKINVNLNIALNNLTDSTDSVQVKNKTDSEETEILELANTNLKQKESQVIDNNCNKNQFTKSNETEKTNDDAIALDNLQCTNENSVLNDSVSLNSENLLNNLQETENIQITSDEKCEQSIQNDEQTCETTEVNKKLENNSSLTHREESKSIIQEELKENEVQDEHGKIENEIIQENSLLSQSTEENSQASNDKQLEIVSILEQNKNNDNVLEVKEKLLEIKPSDQFKENTEGSKKLAELNEKSSNELTIIKSTEKDKERNKSHSSPRKSKDRSSTERNHHHHSRSSHKHSISSEKKTESSPSKSLSKTNTDKPNEHSNRTIRKESSEKPKSEERKIESNKNSQNNTNATNEKFKSQQTILQRMLAIDIQIHKLMQEKIQLYEQLQMDIPIPILSTSPIHLNVFDKERDQLSIYSTDSNLLDHYNQLRQQSVTPDFTPNSLNVSTNLIKNLLNNAKRAVSITPSESSYDVDSDNLSNKILRNKRKLDDNEPKNNKRKKPETNVPNQQIDKKGINTRIRNKSIKTNIVKDKEIVHNVKETVPFNLRNIKSNKKSKKDNKIIDKKIDSNVKKSGTNNHTNTKSGHLNSGSEQNHRKVEKNLRKPINNNNEPNSLEESKLPKINISNYSDSETVLNDSKTESARIETNEIKQTDKNRNSDSIIVEENQPYVILSNNLNVESQNNNKKLNRLPVKKINSDDNSYDSDISRTTARSSSNVFNKQDKTFRKFRKLDTDDDNISSDASKTELKPITLKIKKLRRVCESDIVSINKLTDDERDMKQKKKKEILRKLKHNSQKDDEEKDIISDSTDEEKLSEFIYSVKRKKKRKQDKKVITKPCFVQLKRLDVHKELVHAKEKEPLETEEESTDQLEIPPTSDGEMKIDETNSVESCYAEMEKIEIKSLDSDKLDQSTPIISYDDNTDGIFCIGHQKSILFLEIVGDEFLAASEDGTIYKYCLNTGQLQDAYTGHKRAVTCMHVTSGQILHLDSMLLYSGSLDCTLKCFDLETSAVLHSVTVEQAIQCMDSAWGHIFLGTYAGLLFIYNIARKKLDEQSLTIADATVLTIKATTEGSRQVLVLASRKREIMVRDAFSGLLLRTMAGDAADCRPTIYSLLLDRSIVYCGTSDRGILLLDFHNGEVRGTLNAGKGVVCMVIHRELLFAGCYDGLIYVYDMRTQRQVARLPGPGQGMLLSLLINKNMIVAGTKKDHLLKIWKMPQEIQDLCE